LKKSAQHLSMFEDWLSKYKLTFALFLITLLKYLEQIGSNQVFIFDESFILFKLNDTNQKKYNHDLIQIPLCYQSFHHLSILKKDILHDSSNEQIDA
jgi:hypothetical protein